ncbi:hypothetical protein MLD38_034453 [Melastoma candidum]|uniref:Uncharacterized protein n=1 Tax=Melastoma candidum TaxID=119954 RepID=A0ACB9MBC3_9MYRT|nr:hypothetical protein MLD38_034453 [Melastoma candidum]
MNSAYRLLLKPNPSSFSNPLASLRESLRSGSKPNEKALSFLIKECALRVAPSSPASVPSAAAIREVREVHAYLTKSGFDWFVDVGTGLVDLMMKLGCMDYALKLSDQMPVRDTVSWNVLICGYSRNGYAREALKVFVEMVREGFSPSVGTVVGLVPCLGHGDDFVLHGMAVHGFGLKVGFFEDVQVKNALLSMYAKWGELDCIESLFEDMVFRSIVSWNAVISAYGQNGLLGEAMNVFKEMVGKGVGVNSVSLISVLSAKGDADPLHCYAFKMGLLGDCSLTTSLVCAYARGGDMGSSKKLYETLDNNKLVALTAVMCGYAEEGNMDLAMMCFSEVQQLDTRTDAVALLGIIHGITNSLQFETGFSFHCYALKTGWCDDFLVANGLITMYSKSNEVEAAISLFSDLTAVSQITWNSIISGCVQAGFAPTAIELFCQMRYSGYNPDTITIASLLSACSHLGYLKCGETLHCYMLRNYIEWEDFVETAMIDMYTKCGTVQKAERVFQSLQKPSLASWNAMITGYSLGGAESDALACFSKMQRQEIQPDKITFLGVLAACTHGGLVQEGRNYFNIMTRDFALDPTMQHRACMASLLGRAGLFGEAMEYVRTEHAKPDFTVWGALLDACLLHREVRLGECFARKLLFLDQNNGGLYILMSNLYASEGRWDDVARVRKMMIYRKDGCHGGSSVEGKTATLGRKVFILHSFSSAPPFIPRFSKTSPLGHTIPTQQSHSRTVLVRAHQRPTWLLGLEAPPPYLDGTLAGDIRFDPLGLGEDPESLNWYVQAKLVHCRFATLGVDGILFTDLLRVTGLKELPVWYEAGAVKYKFGSTETLSSSICY